MVVINALKKVGSVMVDVYDAALYLGVMWLVEFIDQAIPFIPLDAFGLRPQLETWQGIAGIFTAPFLHGDWNHLYGNTIGYIPLALLVIAAAPGRFKLIFWAIAIIAGAGVWAFAPPNSIHVGSSSIVFGLLGFCLSAAIWQRNAFNGFLSGLTAVLYIGVLPGLFPGNPGISWQGHLWGFIGGVVLGAVLLGGNYVFGSTKN